jgi:hypothetical protein
MCDLFRLFQQECIARAASVSDDLMFLNDLDSDLFQRMGILAAFDSWERAKRLIYISFEKTTNNRFIFCFSYFDELLTPFSPLFADSRSSYPGNNRRRRTHGRQSSFDSTSNRPFYTRVKNKTKKCLFEIVFFDN